MKNGEDMSAPLFDAYFSSEALEEIRTQEGVDAYHARINGSHIRSVYQNIPASLDLFCHKFGNYFTILLSDALCENDSVESIGLEMNQVGDRGAKALAWALCINRSVLRLDLSNNRIGVEGIRALVNGPMCRNPMMVSWRLSDNMNRERNDSFRDVEKVYREAIAMLRRSKSVLEYHGPYERDLEDTLAANRLRAELLAEIIMYSPENITKGQMEDLLESQGSVIYVLRESGCSREMVTKLFAGIAKTAERFHRSFALPTVPQVRPTLHFLPQEEDSEDARLPMEEGELFAAKACGNNEKA